MQFNTVIDNTIIFKIFDADIDRFIAELVGIGVNLDEKVRPNPFNFLSYGILSNSGGLKPRDLIEM